MKTTTALAFVLFALSCASSAHSVTFDWATVGRAGGVHSEKYAYRVSKHEVTNNQYTEFLNAVADTDTNSLYRCTATCSNTLYGITRSGSSGSYMYAVKSDSIGNGPGGTDYTYGNKPVVSVDFFDAMRFTNWLENGQTTGAQGAGTTEAGVYNIGTGLDEVRNPNARFFIPREDEWIKAAYHKNDGSGGNQWDYPTSSDSVPNNNLPSADTGNSANHANSNSSYPLTDVGAYTQSESPYGTFDQGGNVWEWNETLIPFGCGFGEVCYHRGIRGGSWQDGTFNLAVSTRRHRFAENGPSDQGFRVASIPEPTTCTLALAALCLAMSRRRSR